MQYCKDCKHVELNDYKYECRLIDMAGVRSPSDAPLDSSVWIEAYANDDSGLDAYLVVGPHFGCVHFT